MLKQEKNKDLNTDMKKNKKASKKSRLTKVYDRESLNQLRFNDLEDEDFDEEC